MATRKQTAEPVEEMTELDAPGIDQEDNQAEEEQQPALPDSKELQEENAFMKEQMAAMREMMASMQEQMAKQAEMMQAMASGKKIQPPRELTTLEKDYNAVHERAKEAAKNGENAWAIEVDIFVPHRDPGEDKFHWVRINDQTAQIPANDSRQTMKLPYALILTDNLKAKKREEDYIDSLVVYDPKENPHEHESIR